MWPLLLPAEELAADLAQITFDYPFRIPPYFALIIRAIGVLEGECAQIQACYAGMLSLHGLLSYDHAWACSAYPILSVLIAHRAARHYNPLNPLSYMILLTAGIALVGNPDFAIVDEAYPYIARRLLTDSSPRLREALRCVMQHELLSASHHRPVCALAHLCTLACTVHMQP